MSYVGNTNTTQGFTPAVDYFSGNGSTVAFTLSRPVASTAQVQVVVNNVAQNPSDAFTVLNNTITFTSAPSSGTNNIYVQYTSPITQVIQPGQGTVTSNSFGLITDFTTTGNTVLGNASTDTLNVGNGGLVKDASGNVGIGTSLPGGKLDVAGGFKIQSNGDVYGASGNTGAIMLCGGGAYNAGGAIKLHGSSNGDYVSFYTGAFAERARINSSGNLLVGATSGPDANTRVYAAATAQEDNNGIIQAASSSNSASIIAKTPIGTAQFFQWDIYGVRIGSRSMSGANAGALYFSTGNDAVAASLDAGRTFRVGNVGPGAAGSAMTVFGGSGGDIVTFHQNRNSSTPYWYFNTSGSYGVFSDARLKDNITEVSQADSVGFVQKLKPVEFNWKPEFGNANQRISGFIAQDVLKAAKTEGQKNILTHWETYDEADTECPKMGLSDHRLLPSIVGALQHALSTIQELKAINDALTARVAALESK